MLYSGEPKEGKRAEVATGRAKAPMPMPKALSLKGTAQQSTARHSTAQHCLRSGAGLVEEQSPKSVLISFDLNLKDLGGSGWLREHLGGSWRISKDSTAQHSIAQHSTA